MSRFKTHLALAAANLIILLAAAYLAPYETVWERLSVVSAWLCMILLCSALLMGPIRRVERRAYRINIYARRDIGIWAALSGLFHFLAGNFVAMNQDYIGAFVDIAPSAPSVSVREQLFSGGSIAGLLVAVLFLLLLAISSDRALRALGVRRWKRLQRSAHAVLWLTVVHGIAFQVLESRYFALLILTAIAAVLLGFQLRARRQPQS